MRQSALPEYRQGEFHYGRPRLRERVGPPVYRSGTGSRPATPCSSFLPQTNHKKNTHPQDREQAGTGQSGNSSNLPAALSRCLPGKNRASSPPKPCHPQSQRYTRSVMPLAKKQQAPRQPERRHAKQGGWASTTLPHAATYRPNPLACKRAARPEYRPCCRKATATRTKNIPRGTG